MASWVVSGAILHVVLRTPHRLPAPLYFRMGRGEVLTYLVLSFLSAPFIDVVFSLLVGWKGSMPFLEIPSLAELLG